MAKPPYFNMNRMKFWRLRTARGIKVCTKGEFDYYNLTLDGYLLMYAKNRYRPDGLRLYVLGDELAKYLGFLNYDYMMCYKPYHIQYGRKMLSVDALQRNFEHPF
jgi:hypothetical protein